MASDIDLMTYIDNFEKTKDVQSNLICGDPDLCPNPLLSIVIPTYRRPNLLKYAIESALSQTDPFCAYEIIVVDNDHLNNEISETYKLIKQFDSPRVLYYQNERNLGMAGNWNRCISLARGYWVSFLHDDDVLMPHCLSRIGLLISGKNNIGGITVSSYIVRSDGEISHARESRARSPRQRLNDYLGYGKLMRTRQFDSNLLSYNTYLAPTCGSIFRRYFLIESGGFNDEQHPNFDWFFLYRYSHKYNMYRTIEKLGYYRMGLNESSQINTKSAFIRGEIAFVGYSSRNSKTGKLMRKVFENEQNCAIFNSKFSDYPGKNHNDYFKDSEVRERKIRLLTYSGMRTLYWHMKTIYYLLFG